MGVKKEKKGQVVFDPKKKNDVELIALNHKEWEGPFTTGPPGVDPNNPDIKGYWTSGSFCFWIEIGGMWFKICV